VAPTFIVYFASSPGFVLSQRCKHSISNINTQLANNQKLESQILFGGVHYFVCSIVQKVRELRQTFVEA
jgi:hypothetical protein